MSIGGRDVLFAWMPVDHLVGRLPAVQEDQAAAAVAAEEEDGVSIVNKGRVRGGGPFTRLFLYLKPNVNMMIMQIHANVVTSTQRVHFFILEEFHNNTCSDKLKETKKNKKKSRVLG